MDERIYKGDFLPNAKLVQVLQICKWFHKKNKYFLEGNIPGGIGGQEDQGE